MKKLICLILIMGFVLHGYTKTYEYAKKINNKIIKDMWEVTEKQNIILLYFKSASLKETVKSDINTGTISWLFEDKLNQTFLKAEKYNDLNKNYIKITGRLNGNKIEKKYEIGDKFWFQNIFLEIKNFILSDKNELEFYFIRKSDGELMSMKIEKKEIQEKVFFKKKIQVIRAELKENNLFADFSKMELWFRKKDGLCLAYTGYNDFSQKNKIMVKLLREIN